MNHDDYLASEHCLELMKKAGLPDEIRQDLAETLTRLESGWWQYDATTGPSTLVGFAEMAAQIVIKRGGLRGGPAYQDLAQDALVEFLMHVASIKTNPRSWIIGTATNLYFSGCRRRRLDRTATSLTDLKFEPPSRSAAGRPVKKLSPNQLQAIENLPPAMRDVLRRKARGETTSHIAEARGCSKAAVRMQMLRAKKILHSARSDR